MIITATALVLAQVFSSVATSEKPTIDTIVKCNGTIQPNMRSQLFDDSKLLLGGETDANGRLRLDSPSNFQAFLQFDGVNCSASGDRRALDRCGGEEDDNMRIPIFVGERYTKEIDLYDDCVFGPEEHTAIRVRGRLTCGEQPLTKEDLVLRKYDKQYDYSNNLEQVSFSLAQIETATRTDLDGRFDAMLVLTRKEELRPLLMIRGANCTIHNPNSVCDGSFDHGTRILELEHNPTEFRRTSTYNIDVSEYCFETLDTWNGNAHKIMKLWATMKFGNKPLAQSEIILRDSFGGFGSREIGNTTTDDEGRFTVFGFLNIVNPYIVPLIYFDYGFCKLHMNACGQKCRDKRLQLYFPKVRHMMPLNCGTIDLEKYCEADEESDFYPECTVEY